MSRRAILTATLLAALLTACGSSNQPDAASICRDHAGIALVQFNKTKNQHEVMCNDGHFEAVGG